MMYLADSASHAGHGMDFSGKTPRVTRNDYSTIVGIPSIIRINGSASLDRTAIVDGLPAI